MAALAIELKKISEERASLACRRPDGTATWSRVHPFFPSHDLTHFAVESELKLRRGFFGLIAEGWQLGDFAARGVAARLPAESLVVENIVGTVEIQGDMPAAEFNAVLAEKLTAQNLPAFRPITEVELGRIREKRAALVTQWRGLPIGGTLRLVFSPGN